MMHYSYIEICTILFWRHYIIGVRKKSISVKISKTSDLFLTEFKLNLPSIRQDQKSIDLESETRFQF